MTLTSDYNTYSQCQVRCNQRPAVLHEQVQEPQPAHTHGVRWDTGPAANSAGAWGVTRSGVT